MSTLTNTQIRNTYDSLLKLADNGNLTTVLKEITDGLGNITPLSISQIAVKSSVDLEASGFKTPTGTSSQFLKADGSIGDLTNYDNAYTHSQSAHAPANAEQNVQSDWDSITGDSLILNKPTIPSGNQIIDWTGASAGTIHITNLPATAITSVQIASTQVAMLALTTQEGDVVVRSDENKTYMHNGGTAGTIADFTELATPTSDVTSVDGATGAIVLNHDSLAGFVSNEHIDWTTNQGATNIHNGNYTDTTYTNVSEFINDAGYTGDQDLSGYLLNTTDTLTGTLTVEGDVALTTALLSYINGSSLALQRMDTRIDATNYSRMHWYGNNDTGGTSNYRSAWYDGSGYINITAASGTATFGGNLAATNLSGTNTGDQDLSGYLLNTTDTLAGKLTISHSDPRLTLSRTNTGNSDEDTVGAIDFYTGDTSSQGQAVNAKIEGFADDIYGRLGLRFFTGGAGAPTEKMRIAHGGNVTFTNDVSANNLSGTNTGDQDLSSFITTSAADGKYLLNTTDTLNGDLTVTGDATFGGNVEIESTSGNQLKLSYNSANFWTIEREQTAGDFNMFTTQSGVTKTSAFKIEAANNNATFGGKLLLGTGASAASTINAYSRTVSANLPSAIRIIENTSASTYWDIGANNGGSPNLNFYVNANTSPKVTFSSSGNVGIGTTSPQTGGGSASWLSINGTAAYSGGIAYTIGSVTKGYSYFESGFLRQQAQLGFGHKFVVNGTNQAVTILSSGNVGIGDTTPSYKLDVNGTIRATGDIIAYSDVRVKKNIKTIDNALDKVKALRGVYFERKDNGAHSTGVIAQEIEKILPEVVATDNEGMKAVAYGNIVGVLIEAIKEQDQQLDFFALQFEAMQKQINDITYKLKN